MYEYVCEECAVVSEELREEKDKEAPATCFMCGGVAYYEEEASVGPVR